MSNDRKAADRHVLCLRRYFQSRPGTKCGMVSPDIIQPHQYGKIQYGRLGKTRESHGCHHQDCGGIPRRKAYRVIPVICSFSGRRWGIPLRLFLLGQRPTQYGFHVVSPPCVLPLSWSYYSILISVCILTKRQNTAISMTNCCAVRILIAVCREVKFYGRQNIHCGQKPL